MKHRLIFLSLVLLNTSYLSAQTNTFPATGNVGIGTSSPAVPLDVNGTARIQTSGNGPALTIVTNGAALYSQVGAFSFNTNGHSYSSLHNSATTAVQNEFRLMRSNNGSFDLSAFGANYTAAEIGVNTAAGIKYNTRGMVSNSISQLEASFYTWDGAYHYDVLRLFSNGNIGINVGATNSGYNLDIGGTTRISGAVRLSGLTADNTQTKVLVGDANGNLFLRDATTLGGSGSGWSLAGNTAINPSTTFLGSTDNSSVAFRTSNVEQMRIDGATGNVGIGTTAPQSKLAVKGVITSQKIVITQTGWADYVFGKDYPLPSLESVAQYIKSNHHLAEVPSAESVNRNGVDLGDNQAVLLKKIEELTLYVIELNEKNKKLEKKVDQLTRAGRRNHKK